MSRQAILDAASAEVGPFDQHKVDGYWKDVLSPGQYQPGIKLAWCGAFALRNLHAAGLALDKHWRFGSGFLLVPPHTLSPTKTPLPGDIGYQGSPFQHHFIIESVDGNLVHSIDGNQPDVRRKTRVISPALVFYSIQPLLALAGDPDSDTNPGIGIIHRTTPAEVQHAINSLAMAHPGPTTPAMLTVDGIIGPKSTAALVWAQGILGVVPVTGLPDDVTCHALGLS